MRTANEIELFPMAQDLIDIVSLSRIFAARDDITLGEACDLVTGAIAHDGKAVEVYRTNEPGIPKCIGEVNGKYDHSDVLDALWMPFKSKWWENPASLTVIQAEWSGAPDSVAIRWADAERLLELTRPDHVGPMVRDEAENFSFEDVFITHEGLVEGDQLVTRGGERRSLALKAARARHAKANEAKVFVKQEWALNKVAYEGNKTAFSRDYVRRVKN